ncbi:large subunit of alpha-aminoadipate reductase [Elasticomyces elasticus]|uniref:Alpha-aminoadipate reductase n=1 Tax=Exophiala sideris TaxID=1016849 RepID=A0ABR0JPW7_9EURO|nr:large subunit of alpha-aminoadipate reductase [Elasticomyces elasticus]KAK5039638.1 large subunit of alpha-aminoadipate reductase [Exophiala sideris]KAK5041190.1 large subunit of alpha-aminoadipate reductase [Exophiala sideris]KAK5068015.1 large subunit of alpha-aminoadipate reductase [Exophiala sideris]KAK5187317.1 large subunit of alpha-aminoadipate reductase [Eurotiomycetes sp. CCFEE 6388]
MAPDADADLAWWAKQLEDQTISPLTRDYPETSSEDVHKRPIEASESLTVPSNTLTKLSADLDATPLVILQTALIVLVSRLTGDEDISIGTNSEENGLSFVLKTILDAKDSFSKVVQQVQKLSLEAAERPVSLEKLRAKLQRPVLFRFAAFNTSQDVVGLQADTIDLLITYTLSSTNDLKLTARYNQRLISSARIAGVLGQITTLIQNAATDVNAPVGSIDFATPEEKKLLPDPTSDLEWSNFRGAIHDIFAANAEAHPDRTCVVETKSEDGPERTFTYQQIHHGSSVFAHHLLKSGLQLGEVVMIYSYRGVDLVVAVMGVLKAGGTFSVLDPAYPPDRQNIYLDVSRPRALVIIEKATQDAGELSDKVRNFIKENLDLRTEVPALRLNDDGLVQGGQLDGKDVFEEVQSLKATRTGVVVGPDSTPTLSFTSGSEGKPKGVKGRHYRAYYFDWMAKTFNLSDKDKFTMLSGIAHDPIQRDMFTPLFLGAQLLVPSKNDIQNERLAEWMREVGATVSHLTPAMGQILVGGAVATFDKLHHAFFVGDILIKRDCRSLQNLAPNVRIVNMYGTTETQRAVSYYEIPSRAENASFLDGLKDVIPAGKGMANVQMLVVNRHDRTKLCAVGELGEIYVRASGLAEEYLGTPELSKTKFVDNWFPGHEVGLNSDKRRFEEKFSHEPWAQHFLGPRDRLYRSGDLGRYTPDFDVECSGRADFQVKIRGYRLELNEIDTHLSQHPLVRENVTLVRRDKFEEQILVSYVVPQMSKWEQFLADQGKEDISDDGSMAGRFERFRLLQQSVQEYLRTKLPVYAVPSIIVPMKSMPLNPNGKIDRPKLPFPDANMLVASRRRKSSMLQNLTESELAMAKIWAELVPGLIPKTIKPTESFFEIGGDSMSSQRLAYQVRKTLGVNLAINKIYNRPTLKDMAAYIDHIRGADSLEGGETKEDQIDAEKPGTEYGQDALEMAKLLPQSFRPAPSGIPARPVVFLTGATGFLGCFILQDLLLRKNPEVKVIVLVRAKDEASAMSRLKMTCQAYGVWAESWSSRIRCVTGSLGPDKFGLSDDTWKQVAEETDIVIHNGAQVHWINTYEMLKPPNVLGTVEAIKLCAEGKPKSFAFVSSTSVLDHDHFVAESERIIAAGGEGVSEEDDLSGSSKGLTTGYGQSKWVGELLVREAGRRGLRGYTVRPGYILGHTKTGVTVTDDFLVRMLKGCVQLKTRPNMGLNTINMAPVDHVARAVVACAFNPPSESTKVACISGNPKLRFNQFLATLQTYGYTTNLIDYIPWCSILNEYVTTNTDFALMPLFTFVANDLPANSVSIELDDTNTEKALYADCEWSGEDVSGGSSVTRNTVGLSLAYLVAIGFLPPPSADHQGGSVKSLPVVKVSDEQKKALLSVGGRGGMS